MQTIATVAHTNGTVFRVIDADSHAARIARNVRPLTMADGTEWTVGLPVGWRGTEAAWRTATVLNFDNHGSYWGADTIAETETLLAGAVADGQTVNEWNVTDRDGCPLRITRICDPTFLDTISVIPA